MERTIDGPVAKLLGTSSDTLSSDLSSGQTLTSIARSEGVSSHSTISTAPESNAPSGVPTLPADQLTSRPISPTAPCLPRRERHRLVQHVLGCSDSHQGCVNSASALDNLVGLLGVSSNSATHFPNGIGLSSSAFNPDHRSRATSKHCYVQRFTASCRRHSRPEPEDRQLSVVQRCNEPLSPTPRAVPFCGVTVSAHGPVTNPVLSFSTFPA